jgi:putative flippase GtrA
LTGGAAAVVDVGVFALLCAIPLPIWFSAVASFCTAAVANYLLSSRFVFHRRPTPRGLGVFMVGASGGLAINVAVTLACGVYLGIPVVLAKIAGIGIAFLFNFWLNLRFVFGRHHEAR